MPPAVASPLQTTQAQIVTAQVTSPVPDAPTPSDDPQSSIVKWPIPSDAAATAITSIAPTPMGTVDSKGGNRFPLWAT
ncbi:hypothetical protein Pmar_PMAR015217, partial [Perkinsus marinus ATCC 50983]